MPVFDFIHEESGETISVIVSIKDTNEARRVQVVDGKTYKRVYSAPTAGINTQITSASQEDFNRMTDGKKIKTGDMWEISKEMSEKRAAKNGGVDPVKEKFYEKYLKETGGEHADVKKRKASEKRKKLMEQFGVKVQ